MANYNYYITAAIAICEGEIDDIERIWADNKLLDKSKITFRLYHGTENQNPDPFIQSIEGIPNTPAYRGLAYFVIENFQINEFGSHIPNFTFEVCRNLVDDYSVENQITGINIIPGSGEFVYDTTIQFKSDIVNVNSENVLDKRKKRINNNTDNSELSDALVALNQMKSTLPSLRYISVVVAWFASSLDMKNCKLYPAVESHDYTTFPDEWKVQNLSRYDAKIITKDAKGNPIYGGTISDKALMNYLKELKKRNYFVVLYPMIFLDLPDKPWRGRITGAASDIDGFFGLLNPNPSISNVFTYNEFILHYANLTKDYIDGFIIGSELKSITSIYFIDQNNKKEFPAVKKFIDLAAKVRSIIEPSGTKNKIITYAADWSEYHSVDGEYNLDSLWADQNINVVGIDAYFPLTDIKSYSYQPNEQEIIDGWTKGEGYDYYYASDDKDHSNPIPYSNPQFAWKNLEYWWSNPHYNYPQGTSTPWVPKMKKIWFTEYGFPSIHGATNMPNIFYNPESSDGGLPIFSNGGMNFDIQRVALEATIKKWKNSPMVQQMFLWCYDARPYPYFPLSQNIWSDGNLWTYGHWVNGKLGRCLLRKIVEDLMSRLNLENTIAINTDQLTQSVDGFIINSNITIIDALKILQQCYFFDIVEKEHEMKFLARGYANPVEIDDEEILLNGTEKQITIKRNDEFDIQNNISFSFISSINDYDVRTANITNDEIEYHHLGKAFPKNNNVLTIDVPIAMNISYAECIASAILYSNLYQRDVYEFQLPISYSALEPGDLIKLQNVTMKIVSITHDIFLKIQAIIDDYTLYYFRQNGSLLSYSGSIITNDKIPKTIVYYGIVPQMNSTSPRIIFPGCGEEDGWRGAIGLIEKNTTKFDFGFSLSGKSNFGQTLNKFDKPNINLTKLPTDIDSTTELYVQLNSGELFSIDDSDFNDDENEDNLIYVSATINSNSNYGEIAKFQKAELIRDRVYKLTNFKRGLFGTEVYVDKHNEFDKFISIDEKTASFKLTPDDKNKKKKFKVVTLGDDLKNGEDFIIDLGVFFEYEMTTKNSEITKINNNEILIKWQSLKKKTRFKVDIVEYLMGHVIRNSFIVDKSELQYKFSYPLHINTIYLYDDENEEKDSFGLYKIIDGQSGDLLEDGYEL